ncbi:MAG: hypothetical protein AB8H86_10795 [Polyangiales bacterium]
MPSEPAQPAAGRSNLESTDDWVELQRSIEFNIQASSNYRDDPTQVERLIDGDFETAWNSATMEEGDTTPQTLTFTLPEGVTVHAIGLTTGYTKVDGTRDLFTGNRRIDHVRIRHGETLVEADLLADAREIQDIPVEGGGGEWVVELTSWEAGERPDWRELVVSELRVLGELGSVAATRNFRPDAAAMRGHADTLLRRYHHSLGSGAQRYEQRELVGEPTLYSVSLANPQAEATLTLAEGRCYAVFGQVERRGGADTGASVVFGEASAPDEWDIYPDGGPQGLFAFGLEPALCARDGELRHTLEFDDPLGIRATIAVFEQVTDPDRLDDPGDDEFADALEGSQAPPGLPAPTMVQRDGLHLARLFLTADVFGRRPGEPQQVYTKEVEEKAYCYFEIANPSAEATTVQLAWLNSEGESRSAPSVVEVPAQRRFVYFRYTTLASRRPGEYSCVLRDAGGAELGRAPMRLDEF